MFIFYVIFRFFRYMMYSTKERKSFSSSPFSNEPLGVSASFTQFLGCFAAFKAIFHIDGSFRVENMIDILPEDISKVYNAVAVKTAGHHRSVNEDAELVFQPVAEKPFALYFGVFIGPFKAFAPFQIEVIANLHPAGIFLPFALYTFL